MAAVTEVIGVEQLLDSGPPAHGQWPHMPPGLPRLACEAQHVPSAQRRCQHRRLAASRKRRRAATHPARNTAGTAVILHDCVAGSMFSERLVYRLYIIHVVVPGCFSTRYLDAGTPPRGEVVSRLPQRQSHQRSTFRIVSDMVGAGALQSRAMSITGATETTATRIHPAKDAAPDM
jgi:hypothetical protein